MTQGHQGRPDRQTPSLPLDAGDFQETASTPSLTTGSGTPQGRAGTPYESTVCPSDSAVSTGIRPNTEGRDGQGRQIQKVHVRAHAPARTLSGRDAPSRPCVPALNNWLTDLRNRNIAVNMTGGTPTIRGAAVTDHDLNMAARYTHALHLAANGTHTTWWTYASGRDRTHWPHVDELPWTCGTCGTPDCPYLDDDLIAWCDLHDLEHQP